MTHRALIRKHHKTVVAAARKLGRAMPGQYEGFRKNLVAAEARFARAVRRYVA